MFCTTSNSVIIALGYHKLSDNLEAIANFYDGEPARLISVHSDESEYCFQLQIENTDVDSLIQALKDVEADTVIYIKTCGTAYAATEEGGYVNLEEKGKFRLAKPHEDTCYIVCCDTNYRYVLD